MQTTPQTSSATPIMLSDEDMAYTILSDLKRVTREYATAATESVCTQTRQMFTTMLDDTLRMQGELFNAMNQNQMYNTASPALRQELDKQHKQYQQTQQQTNQFVEQCHASGGQMHPGAMNNAQAGGQQQSAGGYVM
ncbi:MAG: spore coat protein [Candidatus Cohnella colombiensis]|uniref:Spore coat protein n=1 Tax=Candidatus Cohnella colombiensis TaxID=3121368 RepID=A0AA95JDQ1_9BACL|nr:MAG: spore coat protein [Cohnella sp.]